MARLVRLFLFFPTLLWISLTTAFTGLASAQVQFVPIQAMSFTMPAGGPNPLPQVLTAASSSSNFFMSFPAATTTSGGTWLTVIGCGSNCFTPQVYSIAVNGTSLPAGVYTGQVAMANTASTITMTIAVTLTVVAPGSPVFGPVAGGLNFVTGLGLTPAPQTVQITNAGSGVLSWTGSVTTAASAPNWLSLSPGSQTAPSLVTVSVSTTGLAAGTYIGRLLFQTTGSSFSIPVTLIVAGSGSGTLQQVPGYHFTMPAGGPNPLPQILTAASFGANFYLSSLTATTASGGNWLSITGCSPSVTNCFTPQVFTLGVNASSLSPGIYAGQVTMTSASSVVVAPVTLTVVAGSTPLFGPLGGGLNFVTGSGLTPASQTLQITNAGTGSLDWTAVVSAGSNGNWLSVSAASGTAPSLVTVNISTQGLTAGTFQGRILFQSAASTVSVPVTLIIAASGTGTLQQVPGYSFTMPVGGPNPLSQVLTAASFGGNFYLTSVTATSAGNWLSVTGCSPTATNCFTPQLYTVGVNGTSLAAGTYTGQVFVSNGSSEVMAPVTLNVVAADSPFFGAVGGGLTFVTGVGLTPAAQTVQITNAGAGTLNWTATVFNGTTAGGNWLSVSAATGTAPSLVTVSISTQGLAAGTYQGRILFVSATSTITVPVSLIVASAGLGTPQQVPGLNFTMPVGGPNPLPQVLTAASFGGNFYLSKVSPSSGGNWLTISGCSPTATNCFTPQLYSVGVNGASLVAGKYAGQVEVSNGASTVIAPVTLTVVAATSPFFGPVAGGLNFVAGTGLTPAAQTVQLTNAGAGSLDWTATVFNGTTSGTGNWLSVSAPTGTAPSLVTVSVSTQGLSAGTYQGRVLFQSANSSVTVPVTLIVAGSGTGTLQQVPGFSFTVSAGGPNPLAQVLTAASFGGNFYLSGVTATSAGNWLTVSGCSPTTTNCFTPQLYSVGVNAASLPVGIYIGQVALSNGSSTVIAPVTLNVVAAGTPFFGTTVGGLSFVSAVGGSPAAQSIQLTNGSSGTLSWTATVFIGSTAGSGNWLSISAAGGTTPAVVTATVSTQGVPAGTYQGRILFQSASSSVTVPVSLIVATSGLGTLQQPPGFTFTMPAGGPNPATQTLTASSFGGNFYLSGVTASSAGGWLTVTGCNPSTTNCFTPQTYAVGVNGLTLSSGIYVGQVVLSNGSSTTVAPVTLTVGNGMPSTVITATPSSLSFTAAEGTSPAGQQVQVTAVNGQSFDVSASTTTGGSWLSVSPAVGVSPGTISVSVNSAGLSPATYNGSVRIGAGGNSLSIPVSLTVTAAATGQLTLSPAALSVQGLSGANVPPQSIAVGNSGSGTLNWTASVATVNGGTWLSISPASGSAALRSPATVQVSFNTQGLNPGVYNATINFTPGPIAVPVRLLVSSNGPAMLLGQSGLVFNGVAGGGSPLPQRVAVSNTGSGTMNWTATVVRGSWISISPASGSSAAAAATLPAFSVQANTSGLAAGVNYGLIQVAAPGAANAPQLVVVVLNVLPSGVLTPVTVDPQGLIFVAPAGAAAAPQTLALATPSAVAVSVTRQTITQSGGSWLSASPSSITLSPGVSGTLTVNASAAGLAPGVYTGTVTVLPLDGSQPTDVNASLVVTSASTAEAAGSRPAGAACVPTKLVLAMRHLGQNFSSPVGWPVSMEALILDDCGNPALNATVLATFTSGDAPLAFASLGGGVYSATWKPSSSNSSSVTIRGLQAPLAPVSITLNGQIAVNPAPPPSVGTGGVVNAASFIQGAELAPGTIVSVFGSNLATSDGNLAGLPLPSTLSGIKMTIGGIDAPLFYAGIGQVNAQVPYQLTPGTQTQVVARAISQSGDELDAVPEPVVISGAKPGIFVAGGTQGAILNVANQLVDSKNPATAGDVIVIFCTGLGATDPPNTTGVPASSGVAVIQPSVTVGKIAAPLQYAGVAPGFVGLFQVNVNVPPGVTPSPAVPVVITQNGSDSNIVTIAVR